MFFHSFFTTLMVFSSAQNACDADVGNLERQSHFKIDVSGNIEPKLC